MAADQITRGTVAGYGAGDFAMNLYWGALSCFLLYWYTDVAGCRRPSPDLSFSPARPGMR